MSNPASKQHPSFGKPLTDQQIKAMRLLCAGYLEKNIADKLCISRFGVASMMRRVKDKLGAKTNPQAAAIFALKDGHGAH